MLKKHKKIIIGIGSSQEKNTSKNPFSYSERKLMIQKVLKSEKIKNCVICPVPDLYDDKKWVNYVKTRLPKFDAAYSGNEWTLRCFKKHKIKVQKIKLIKGISSTLIRQKIIQDKKWKNIAPKEIFNFINQAKYKRRII